ncbi:uncharacterized protein LOC125062679 [Pieris napi]|uniref:uncharacterized protein LOC125062679 n=1 Tax=Pieris napi TaxID=78633 RepID=UPI001FBB2546|nr:uncharacterized protein LOC125062679 [Pieris napi]
MTQICILILSMCIYYASADDKHINLTSPKDMYVVRATVYQVGILTNKTKDSDLNKTGQQEAITFYQNKGTGINLNNIPAPLVTNVTAENIVGVAPANAPFPLNMSLLGNATTLQRLPREVVIPANITKASLFIPAAAGVQSISLPPLLSFNNNISKIPVPLPNVSVVSYTKASTLVKKP